MHKRERPSLLVYKCEDIEDSRDNNNDDSSEGCSSEECQYGVPLPDSGGGGGGGGGSISVFSSQ